ncbi:MAG: sensor domain-containing protein, partial [Mycobacterium sp.]
MTRARVLVVGIVVVAVTALSGCVSTVSGTAVRNRMTVPTNVPRLDDSAVDHVLLPIGEINDVMGTTNLEITSDIKNMTDSSDKVSDADCLGAMFGAEKPVYKGSGWTAVRDVV